MTVSSPKVALGAPLHEKKQRNYGPARRVTSPLPPWSLFSRPPSRNYLIKNKIENHPLIEVVNKEACFGVVLVRFHPENRPRSPLLVHSEEADP
jgi:hypothetical protein